VPAPNSWGMRLPTALLALPLLVALTAAAPGAVAGGPEVGDTTVFAAIGTPGHPDTTIVLPGGDIAVSTNRGARGAEGPSKVFRYRPDGRLVRTYTITGQSSGDHGTMGMAVDRQGRLYLADYAPARVLRIDLRTGVQKTYAALPDLPTCDTGIVPCDNGVGNARPWTDGLAFDRSGRLLVTDLAQGTVFRVPNGGGEAQVWLQGPELRSTFGANQLQLTPDGDLLLSVTSSAMPGLTGRGVLYRVDVDRSGSAGTLTQLYATAPGEGPDGFALGTSGRIYLVTLVTDRLVVLAPDGTEQRSFVRPFTGDAPFDSPSSATLVGDGKLLVTNLTYFTGSSERALVLSVHVDDEPVPDLRPAVR
jgi:sugar lactone lactonase YvrE